MKTAVRDSKILKTIDFQKIAARLRGTGWQEICPIYNGTASVWRWKRDTEEELELLLPLRRDFADYAPRINDAIRAMAEVERRSQLDVLSDLLDSIDGLEIQGMVTQIQLEKAPRTITIMGAVWGKLRKIYARLSESDYALAVKAYQERLPVACTGDIIKEGNAFVLDNIRNFSLDRAFLK